MKKHRLKNYLKLGILLFGIAIFVIACEKDNFAEEKTLETITEELPISIKSISISEVGETFNSLKNKYQLNNHFELQQTENTQLRVSSESDNASSSITIYTDEVKEITQGDYTSYTMLIESLDDDPNTFYNITIEDKNGTEGMFVTQYKTENTSDDLQNQAFSSIQTERINNLTEPLGPEDFGNEDPSSSGSGSGGGGGNTNYPTDCNGTVIPTTIAIEYNCGCGHNVLQWQLGICSGSSCGDPFLPYIEYQTTYECLDSGVSDPPNGGDPNNGNPPNSGGSTNSGGDTYTNTNPSLTSPIDREQDAVSQESDNCRTLKDLRKTDSLSLNIKPIIDQLKAKTNEKKEWYQEVQRQFGDTDYETFPTPGGIKEGIDDRTSKFTTSTFNIGIIHTHPKGKKPMFSWTDIRATRDIYREVGAFGKEQVFNICVNHNGTVYALKIDDYEALNAKIESDWTNARGNTDEKKRSGIEWKLGK
ncbi:hypothetical protein [Winogradskyella wichelsiae]|uniref:hypothetical protein n=1 Tax=Winogradskyella wichelsiae TaxID=2697007 RepID=UPI0015CB053F|nr:hypothetical protein [Winogradskyella wichelsiae]